MSIEESFRDKVFVVEDPDTRIRRDDDKLAFLLDAAGHFKSIPKGAKVRVVDISIQEAGSNSSIIIFGRVASPDGAQVFGWTSTRNFEGKLMNETLGALPPESGASRFGPNAAWLNGNFLGQVDLVSIVDSKQEIKRLALKTVPPYAALVAAAAAEGVQITLNSGFRSYPEQKNLFDGFTRKLPGFNTAAKPGFSNHQNGIAFDIAVAGGDGNPTYEWLKRHATSFGFVRTVSKEPWHWEFDEAKSRAASAAGTFKAPNVTA